MMLILYNENMEQIDWKWVFGFLKSNRYTFYCPLFLGILIFLVFRILGVPTSLIPPYIIFILIEVLCFIGWFFKLFKIPGFKEDEIGILIVFPTVPRLYDEIKLISDELFRLISRLSVQNSIKVKFTRNNLFLNKEKEIQKILLKTRASLILYAEFLYDTKNNEDLCHFRHLQFCTRFPSGILSLQKDIEQDFHKIPMGYFLRDTLGKRDKVIESVGILSMVLLSNALRAFGQIEKAEELLHNLKKKFSQVRNSSFIKKNLAICKLVRCRNLYYSKIYANGMFNTDEEILKQIRQELLQAYQYYEYGDIFLLLSVVNFLLGEEKKAWANIQRVLSRSPKGSYVANFSYSFLFCFKNNIIDAKHNLDKFYNDSDARPINSDGLWHMIHFTEYILSLYPKKYCLYFHLSYVYRLLSFNIALEKMQKFLEECDANNAPAQFTELANEAILFYKSEIEDGLQT